MEAVISCIMNRPMGHCQETHGTKLWPMLKRPQTMGLESCLRNGDLTESARSVLRLKTRLVCDQAFVIPTPLGIVLTMCQGSLRVLPFRVIVPSPTRTGLTRRSAFSGLTNTRNSPQAAALLKSQQIESLREAQSHFAELNKKQDAKYLATE